MQDHKRDFFTLGQKLRRTKKPACGKIASRLLKSFAVSTFSIRLSQAKSAAVISYSSRKNSKKGSSNLVIALTTSSTNPP